MRELDEFLQARLERPFAYFEADCARLAADWVLVRTGRDPLAPLRLAGGALEPRRLLPALRYVHAQGGFVAAATALLGDSVLGLMARRGDVVMVRSGRRVGRVSGYAFGVCTGQHVVVPGAHRLVFLGMTAGVAAWRI